MSYNNICVYIYIIMFAGRETYCSLEQWTNFYYILFEGKKTASLYRSLLHIILYYIMRDIFRYFVRRAIKIFCTLDCIIYNVQGDLNIRLTATMMIYGIFQNSRRLPVHRDGAYVIGDSCCRCRSKIKGLFEFF